ncbi:MAG: peptide chain release factor N(5)-glutamine methyltransferase [bacterium]|nr:peptide chain release factor N(5)-glutamine methyltransferase [bacterium]
MSEASDLAEHEAVRLLLSAAGKDRGWLVGDPAIDEPTLRRFRDLVTRRRGREPLQYIEGFAGFGPIDVLVDRRALIPRPETERLWELAVDALDGIAEPCVIDLCAGSGNLALALKHRFPRSCVIGVDVSPDALALAEANAARLGLEVDFLLGDLFAALPDDWREDVHLIVSNPPYVSDAEYMRLPAEIVEHEPRMALVAGQDGLDVLARIAAEAIDWLRPGGVVACEIGETQGDACMDLFAAYAPEIRQDLAGRDRFVIGCAPMSANVH